MKVHKFNVLSFLTGADHKINNQVLWAFCCLFCLLSSYYLIKPLRKGFYFSEFSADLLPYFHLGVIALIVFATAILVRVFKTTTASNSTQIFLSVVTVINVSLGITLLTPNKVNVACFCLWSSIYFPLSLALFWGGVNQIFDIKSSKSSYAFIWIGAILGALCGSFITILINKTIEDLDWGYQFLFSTIFMLMAIFAFRKMIKTNSIAHTQNSSHLCDKLKYGNLSSMVKNLFKNPYLAGMAIIIFSLTFSRGVFDLQSDVIVEKEVAANLFIVHFSDLNESVTKNVQQKSINENLFSFIFEYKNLSSDLKEKAFISTNSTLNLGIDKSSFDEKYESFRKAMKREITLFNSEIWTYQNSISLLILLICKSKLITKVGIQPLIMCLPITYIAVFLILFSPISLMEIFVLKVIILALDYSLNNTAKEILYVPLGETVNIGYKPIIEGPLFKLGAASSSGYKILLDNLLYLVSSAHLVSYIFIGTAGLVAICWARTAKALSHRFELLKS